MDWINRMVKIINKIKFQLFGRKYLDLQHLYANMIKFDPQGTYLMQKDTFQKFLNQSGIFLTTQELRNIYDYYDLNKGKLSLTDQKINYYDFIQSVKKHISQKRIAAIRYTYDILTNYNTNKLNLSQLLLKYNAKMHPHVRTRTKSLFEIQREFQSSFPKKSLDGINLTEQQFFQYYSDVNCCVPHQRQQVKMNYKYFIDLLLHPWGIREGLFYLSHQKIRELQLLLYQKIRQRTTNRTDEGLTAKNAFRYFDLQDKGVCDIVGFKRAIDKFGCNFKEQQYVALFVKYDKNRNGKKYLQGLLQYEEFCAMVNEMGSGKKMNTNPIFEQQQKTKKGFTSSLQMTKNINLY